MQNVTLVELLKGVKAAYEAADNEANTAEHRDHEYEDHIREQGEFDTDMVVDLFKEQDITEYAEWLVWAYDYHNGYVAELAKAVECELAFAQARDAGEITC